MEKKFALTDISKTLWVGEDEEEVTLYRIIALKDFGNVKAGDLGGFVEKEENLSQDYYCWVYEDACIYGNARICFNAQVYGHAQVYDYAEVGGDAKVYGNAWVYENACVYGDISIFGDSRLCGNTYIE